MTIPLPPSHPLYDSQPETPQPAAPQPAAPPAPQPPKAPSNRIGPAVYSQPSPPPPPQPKAPDKRMTTDETSFLLDRYLIPQHRSDPNVLRFISSYLICRSVSQAAKEAGIDKRSGENLKRRPDIHEAIVAITEKAVLKFGYDASEIVERVKEITSVDPLELENDDGSFRHMRDIAPEMRRAIKRFKARNLYELDPNGVRVIKGEILEYEFWDKLKAVELLGREKNTFKETKKVEHDVGANMSTLLLESKRRAEEIPAIDVESKDVL